MPNSNRIRIRSADSGGSGLYDQECNFPFIYSVNTYNACTTVGNGGVLWCSTKTDSSDNHITGNWGNCQAASSELVDKADVTYSDEKTCTDHVHVGSGFENGPNL